MRDADPSDSVAPFAASVCQPMETMFLNAVLPMGVEGGAPDEAVLIERIKYAVLAAKGIPLLKQQVVFQYVNDKPTDPQFHDDAEGEPPTLDGMFVTLWIQASPHCRLLDCDAVSHPPPPNCEVLRTYEWPRTSR